MVSIVENWSYVDGRIEDVRPGDGGAVAITVRVARVAAVERSAGTFYPNFAEGREGSALRIRLPEPAARKLAPAVGQTVRARVRRGQAPDEFFAHPDDVSVIRP